MPDTPASLTVVRTPAFDSLLADYAKTHRKLDADIGWLESKLKLAPEQMGERVPQLQNFKLPIYKTRSKDSCHNIGASGGWRVYYALNKETRKVFLLFIHHKRESENPRLAFLIQKIERALASGMKEVQQ